MVLVGDIAKGSLAVIVSRELFGISDPWILLPAGAAILGHWASIFSGLRGGDGLATLGGATLALFPILGFVSILIGMLIQLGGQKLPYSSLLGVVAAYGALAASVIVNEGDRTLVIGIGGLAGLVLSWALRGHRRRKHEPDWEQIEETAVTQDQPNRR
jgi:glycerol-3-phosphate acyltransferase PlsY